MLQLTHRDESSSPAERRRVCRVREARPIKIFEPAGRRYYGGRTEDISATGLRVELPLSTPLLPGRLLQVHVGHPAGDDPIASRRQMVPGRVVWVNRPASDASRVMAGIEFIAATAAKLDAA